MICDEEFRKGFGIKLKELRESFGDSQKDLAFEIGIGQATIQNYEQGRNNIPFYAVYKIATYYGLTLDELLGAELMKKDKYKEVDNG